jgi:hypothetical protein
MLLEEVACFIVELVGISHLDTEEISPKSVGKDVPG